MSGLFSVNLDRMSKKIYNIFGRITVRYPIAHYTENYILLVLFLSFDSFSIFLTFLKIDLTLNRASCSFSTHPWYDLPTCRSFFCKINPLLKPLPQPYPSPIHIVYDKFCLNKDYIDFKMLSLWIWFFR